MTEQTTSPGLDPAEPAVVEAQWAVYELARAIEAGPFCAPEELKARCRAVVRTVPPLLDKLSTHEAAVRADERAAVLREVDRLGIAHPESDYGRGWNAALSGVRALATGSPFVTPDPTAATCYEDCDGWPCPTVRALPLADTEGTKP